MKKGSVEFGDATLYYELGVKIQIVPHPGVDPPVFSWIETVELYERLGGLILDAGDDQQEES